MKADKTAKANSQPRAKHRPGEQFVHLELDLPPAQKVCITGTFNNWSLEGAEMEPAGNGRWVKDVLLRPGTYEYRVVVDGKWMADPNSDHSVLNPYGERNSLLNVP